MYQHGPDPYPVTADPLPPHTTAVPMTDRLDFATLFRELDLAPECSPEQLRAAYRRLVSRLHPDQGGDAQDTGRLQQLNRLYRAALDFERAHGRLPGASGAETGLGRTRPMPSPEAQTGAAAANARWTARPAEARSEAARHQEIRREEVRQHAPFLREAHPQDTEDRPARFRAVEPGAGDAPAPARERIPRSFRLLALAAVCVLAWRILADMASAASAPAELDVASPAPTQAAGPAAMQAAAEPHDGLIAQGMAQATVLDIQGEPLDRHAQRWLYGPSWVEFACGRVIDWYSSPLQPLRVRMERPTTSAADACTP